MSKLYRVDIEIALSPLPADKNVPIRKRSVAVMVPVDGLNDVLVNSCCSLTGLALASAFSEEMRSRDLVEVPKMVIQR